jgi:ADP-ribose pyrophosphatase
MPEAGYLQTAPLLSLPDGKSNRSRHWVLLHDNAIMSGNDHGPRFKMLFGGRIQQRQPMMSAKDWPRILGRTMTRVSPWLSLVARDVQFAPSTPSEIYHTVAVSDYIHIFALTPDGRIPLVRQYRPAMERFTLEIPAGLREDDEEPKHAAIRELLEETGFPARAIHPLGAYTTDPGRLDNWTHSFFVETDERISDFTPEPQIEVRLVTPQELFQLIRAGELSAQGHVGTVLQAVFHGHLQPC